jgi:hypothetical protein
VQISEYDGSAMEPYISCDGRYLFFNNRNEPAEQTDILFAEKSGDDAFPFLGPPPGVNQPPPVLDAVPSMDARGELFFSPRAATKRRSPRSMPATSATARYCPSAR